MNEIIRYAMCTNVLTFD